MFEGSTKKLEEGQWGDVRMVVAGIGNPSPMYSGLNNSVVSSLSNHYDRTQEAHSLRSAADSGLWHSTRRKQQCWGRKKGLDNSRMVAICLASGDSFRERLRCYHKFGCRALVLPVPLIGGSRIHTRL